MKDEERLELYIKAVDRIEAKIREYHKWLIEHTKQEEKELGFTHPVTIEIAYAKLKFESVFQLSETERREKK